MTQLETRPQQIQKCLEYIDSYWNKIILDPQKLQKKTKQIWRLVKRYPGDTNEYHILELPHTAILSNDKKYQYVFYWDNYFSFRGLLDTKRSGVILDMVKNFAYLLKKYHIIPNFNHPESLGRSQAPFFSSMVLDGFHVLTEQNKKSIFALWWLKKYMQVAKTEYLDVWESPMNVDHKHYNHKVEAFQLNRYGDRDVGYGMHAEQESGWDMTSRFYNRCHEFLPIGLNCFLYTYEQNFAHAAQILKNTKESTHWSHVAQ